MLFHSFGASNALDVGTRPWIPTDSVQKRTNSAGIYSPSTLPECIFLQAVNGASFLQDNDTRANIGEEVPEEIPIGGMTLVLSK